MADHACGIERLKKVAPRSITREDENFGILRYFTWSASYRVSIVPSRAWPKTKGCANGLTG